MINFTNKTRKEKRIKRTRAKIFGTGERPRLSVFRSNKFVYVQLIDDQKGETLACFSDQNLAKEKKPKIEKAKLVGEEIAKIALKKNIKEIVFDRRGYKYHGIVEAVAKSAREKGLKF